MPKVIIIGSGFGALAAAKKFKHKDVEVTMIAKTTHHLFQPLLYQVATGILPVGEIAPLNRTIFKNQKNVSVILGEVTDIDIKSKTVVSHLEGIDTTYNYDYLIVATGADQSYFGNDHFAEYAPGLKTLDDALELRSRILNAFELAEIETDPEKKARLLTFVVVGAGPTGVEMVGQITELANRTLNGAYRTFGCNDVQVYLLDAAPLVLPPFGEKLGGKAQKHLEKLGVKVLLNQMVTNINDEGVTIKDKSGAEVTIKSYCKVWSAGVSASKLGKLVAEQSGTETDRAGRVIVGPDLTIKDHPEVFVIGDLMSVPGVAGQSPGAMQAGRYVAKIIFSEGNHNSNQPRKPFKYIDKGSMATVSKFYAVAQVKKINMTGYLAWLSWLTVHLYYLVGFKNRFTTTLSWFFTFSSNSRSQLAATKQQMIARNIIVKDVPKQASDKPIQKVANKSTAKAK